MSTFDDLAAAAGAAPTLEAGLAALLGGLAARIKATSNDQNAQRLARELKAAAPELAKALAARAPA